MLGCFVRGLGLGGGFRHLAAFGGFCVGLRLGFHRELGLAIGIGFGLGIGLHAVFGFKLGLAVELGLGFRFDLHLLLCIKLCLGFGGVLLLGLKFRKAIRFSLRLRLVGSFDFGGIGGGPGLLLGFGHCLGVLFGLGLGGGGGSGFRVVSSRLRGTDGFAFDDGFLGRFLFRKLGDFGLLLRCSGGGSGGLLGGGAVGLRFLQRGFGRLHGAGSRLLGEGLGLLVGLCGGEGGGGSGRSGRSGLHGRGLRSFRGFSVSGGAGFGRGFRGCGGGALGGGGVAGSFSHGLVRGVGGGLCGLGGIGLCLDGSLRRVETVLSGAGVARGGLGIDGRGLEGGLSLALGLVLHGGGVAFLRADGVCGVLVLSGECGFEFGCRSCV